MGVSCMEKDFNKIENHEMIKRLLVSEDYYEYCIIESYRELNVDHAYLIGINGFYVKVICFGSRLVVASVVFPKAWKVEEVAEWLYGSDIGIAMENEHGYFVERANCILGGVFFKERCIVAYVSGTETVYCWEDTYVDAGKLYGEEKCRVDLMFPKPTSSISIHSYQEKYIEDTTCIVPSEKLESLNNISTVNIEVQGNSTITLTIN